MMKKIALFFAISGLVFLFYGFYLLMFTSQNSIIFTGAASLLFISAALIMRKIRKNQI